MSDPALRLQGVYQSLSAQFPTGADLSPAEQKIAMELVANWLQQGISTAIGEIECEGLATDEEVAAPSPGVIERLRSLSQEFAAYRTGGARASVYRQRPRDCRCGSPGRRRPA